MRFVLPSRIPIIIALAAMALSAVFVRADADAGGQGPASKPLQYFVVVTGGELLEGVYPDAHTPFLTRALRPLGCQCVGSIIVDDERQDIQGALRFATNRAPLIIITGGLGPTPNDITRQTVSEFIGIPLREDPTVMDDLAKRLNQPKEQLKPNLRRQTEMPIKGGHLKNANGTAAGLVFDAGQTILVALPGPPRELQPMVRNELVPYLRQHFGVRDFGSSLTLRFVGAGQSLIDQTIKDHVAIAPDVVITSLFEGSRVDFTFSLAGHTPQDQERLKKLDDAIREHLAEFIYADDGSSLEEVVIQKLRARDAKLVLVEAGSGGALAAALNSVTGSAEILVGAFVAGTEVAFKKLLAAAPSEDGSAPVPKNQSLAMQAAAQTGANCVIVTSPIETEVSGAHFVSVLYKLPDNRWETQRVALRDSGEISRATLTTQILDFLRRRL